MEGRFTLTSFTHTHLQNNQPTPSPSVERANNDIDIEGDEEEDDSSDDEEDDDIDIEGDEEEDDSSDDDEDDDIDIEEDEYLALADSTAVTLPTVDHAPSTEETEPFETDESAATPPPHPVYRITARMSIRPQTPISLPSNIKIARLMAIPTPPPSPLSLLSSPLPHIPSPLLPLLSPSPTDPTYEEAPLGYRAIRLRWSAKRREIPEADLPLRKRLCTAHTGTYELGESSAAAAARLGEPVRDDLYRFVDTDDLVGAIQEIAPTTLEGVNQRVTELSTTFVLETSMIYAMIKEKRDDQALQRARVNRLFRDRRYHARTASLMKGEARASRTAWAQSMDASDAAHSRVIELRTQQEEIRELRAADRKLHAKFIKALTALKSCQTQLTAALGRIQILEAARVPTQPEVPKEVGSSS
nr:hypothetical protein [Tanacetum cinerariifolium]